MNTIPQEVPFRYPEKIINKRLVYDDSFPKKYHGTIQCLMQYGQDIKEQGYLVELTGNHFGFGVLTVNVPEGFTV